MDLYTAFTRSLASLYAYDPAEADDAMEQVKLWARDFIKETRQTALQAMFRKATDEEALSNFSVRKTDAKWQLQREHFPEDFHDEALYAYRLGAPLPGWVTVYALSHGAEPREAEAELPQRRALTGDVAPAPVSMGLGGPVAPAAPRQVYTQAGPPAGYRSALVAA